MADVLDSLWSPDIRPNILSPFAIIEPQARALAGITNGLLVGDVSIAYDDDRKNAFLNLDLVVPALENYRHRILRATYRTAMMYPVRVDAECFRPKAWAPKAGECLPSGRGKPENEAASDKELRVVLEKVLKSDEVTSLAVSLIARANDVLAAKQGEASAHAALVTVPSEEPGENE